MGHFLGNPSVVDAFVLDLDVEFAEVHPDVLRQRMGNVHVQSFENGWLVFTVFNMLEVWLEETISDHPNGIQVAAVRIFIISFLNANDLGQNIRAQSFPLMHYLAEPHVVK